MTDGTASFREFADVLRCKPSYVTELRKAGRLVLTDDRKRVRVAESVALIEATRDPSKRGVAERHEASRPAAPPIDAPADDDDDDDTEKPESPYHSHKAEREKWLAAAARRDYELSIGKLMEASEVESAIAQAGTTLRQALERLPDALAPQLAPISDEARVHSILTSEIDQALRELARQFAGIAKAVTP